MVKALDYRVRMGQPGPAISLQLLGTAGGIGSPRRATACVLVRRGRGALLLDAGTGLWRLAADPSPLAGVERIDLVLSHLHLDHVAGLAAVPSLPAPVTIWAPGGWLYGTPSERLLEPLMTAPLSPHARADMGKVAELGEGATWIGDFQVAARAQLRHYAPSAGLRIDDELAYLTDTAYDAGSGEFAASVRVLLHDAWSQPDDADTRRFDASAADAGRVAAEAGAGRLVLTHLDVRTADPVALAAAAARHFPGAEVGEDGAVL